MKSRALRSCGAQLTRPLLMQRIREESAATLTGFQPMYIQRKFSTYELLRQDSSLYTLTSRWESDSFEIAYSSREEIRNLFWRQLSVSQVAMQGEGGSERPHVRGTNRTGPDKMVVSVYRGKMRGWP